MDSPQCYNPKWDNHNEEPSSIFDLFFSHTCCQIHDCPPFKRKWKWSSKSFHWSNTAAAANKSFSYLFGCDAALKIQWQTPWGWAGWQVGADLGAPSCIGYCWGWQPDFIFFVEIEECTRQSTSVRTRQATTSAAPITKDGLSLKLAAKVKCPSPRRKKKKEEQWVVQHEAFLSH